MKKLTTFILFVLVAGSTAYAETVSLSTYYPAPFGAYDRLRLVPRATAPSCTAALEGLMYYDAGENLIKICRSASAGFEYFPGVWTQNNIDSSNADVFLSEPSRNVNVGIGTIEPSRLLTLKGQGNTPWLAVHRTSTNFEQLRLVNAEGSAYTASSGLSSGTWTNVIDSNNSDFMISSVNSGGTGGDIILDGNVGIGTTNPQDELDVNGGILQSANVGAELYAVGLRRSGSANTVADVFSENDDGLVLGSAVGDDTLVIADDENVGIGTNNPQEKLDVDGSIRLRDNGVNWGKLMVQYDSGTQGYYAVYAP